MILDVTPVPYHHHPDVLLHMVDATQTGERTLLVIEPLKQGLELQGLANLNVAEFRIDRSVLQTNYLFISSFVL